MRRYGGTDVRMYGGAPLEADHSPHPLLSGPYDPPPLSGVSPLELGGLDGLPSPPPRGAPPPPPYSPLELGELGGLPGPEPEACGVHRDGAEIAAEEIAAVPAHLGGGEGRVEG